MKQISLITIQATHRFPEIESIALNVDNQNRIWVGTDKGIGIFDGSSWIVYNRTIQV